MKTAITKQLDAQVLARLNDVMTYRLGLDGDPDGWGSELVAGVSSESVEGGSGELVGCCPPPLSFPLLVVFGFFVAVGGTGVREAVAVGV